MGFIVVGKPVAQVITSLPAEIARSASNGDRSADMASRFAEDPELVKTVCRTPRKEASRLASSSFHGPGVSQKSRDASMAF